MGISAGYGMDAPMIGPQAMAGMAQQVGAAVMAMLFSAVDIFGIAYRPRPPGCSQRALSVAFVGGVLGCAVVVGEILATCRGWQKHKAGLPPKMQACAVIQELPGQWHGQQECS